MYDVIDIADEILRIAKRREKSLTPLQLMKLVYISHGWSLGLDRGDLFSNRIEAWKYGPVIPDLYRATKSYGRDPIPLDKIDLRAMSVDTATSAFLEKVFEKYGHLSWYQLSQLTHRAGTPWQQVYDPLEMGTEIPDGIIREHYKGLLDERAGGSGTAGGQ
jgi:uncharacterized phage-associated protein